MRILVVEDQESHIQDARAILDQEGVEYDLVRTEGAAVRQLRDGDQFDGVITDLFLPHSDKAPWTDADQPCGLAVALKAEQLGLPFVICTSGYHHGAKYDWICQVGRQRGWPEMVDSSTDYTKEADKKNWKEALEVLLELIAAKAK
ncbi:MAG: response regulator [Patescibacteria group bacterium]